METRLNVTLIHTRTHTHTHTHSTHKRIHTDMHTHTRTHALSLSHTHVCTHANILSHSHTEHRNFLKLISSQNGLEVGNFHLNELGNFPRFMNSYVGWLIREFPVIPMLYSLHSSYSSYHISMIGKYG